MNHTSKATLASVSCAAIVCFSLTIAACHREVTRESASLPNVSVIDDHGRPVSLSSLKGKVVLLDAANLTAIPLTFPIRVGAWYRPIILPALIILAVLALTAIPIVRHYLFLQNGEADPDTHIAAA